MSSVTEPNGTTHTQVDSGRYAMTLVVTASTADEAYDFVTGLLHKPHPWEGPCSAAFVGEPTEIDYQEEYDSAGVATKILNAAREALADQALTASVLDEAEERKKDLQRIVSADDLPKVLDELGADRLEELGIESQLDPHAAQREAEADLREQLGDGADCEQAAHRDDMPEDGAHQ